MPFRALIQLSGRLQIHRLETENLHLSGGLQMQYPQMYLKSCPARFNQLVYLMPSSGQDQLVLLQAALLCKSSTHAPHAFKD